MSNVHDLQHPDVKQREPESVVLRAVIGSTGLGNGHEGLQLGAPTSWGLGSGGIYVWGVGVGEGCLYKKCATRFM